MDIFQLRNHPPPRQEQFDNLLKCAATRGFHVDTSSNKALAASLDACMDSKDPLVNSVGADTQVDSPVDDLRPLVIVQVLINSVGADIQVDSPVDDACDIASFMTKILW